MKVISSIGIWIVALLSLVLAVFSVYKLTTEKVAYIELATVFNEFEMTQQYKKKLDAVVMARKTITDSLELSLKAQSRTLNNAGKISNTAADDFENNRQYYVDRVKQFQEDNLTLKRQYDGEINKQLNQYVKEYGEKNHYRFIYGADGSGVIMFARENENISKDVIKYINDRYSGSAK